MCVLSVPKRATPTRLSALLVCCSHGNRKSCRALSKIPFLGTATAAGTAGLAGAGAALGCSWTVRGHRCTPRMTLSFLPFLLLHHSFRSPESQKQCCDLRIIFTVYLVTKSVWPLCPPSYLQHVCTCSWFPSSLGYLKALGHF